MQITDYVAQMISEYELEIAESEPLIEAYHIGNARCWQRRCGSYVERDTTDETFIAIQNQIDCAKQAIEDMKRWFL